MNRPIKLPKPPRPSIESDRPTDTAVASEQAALQRERQIAAGLIVPAAEAPAVPRRELELERMAERLGLSNDLERAPAAPMRRLEPAQVEAYRAELAQRDRAIKAGRGGWYIAKPRPMARAYPRRDNADPSTWRSLYTIGGDR